MSSCTEIGKALDELAACGPEKLPPGVREHLSACTTSARALWARGVRQQTREALLIERGRLRGRGGSDDGV